MTDAGTGSLPRSRREKLREIIFGTETPVGRWFDVLLIGSILLSVAVVMLDSIASIQSRYGSLLYGAEWFFTALFSVEYLLRLSCSRKPGAYASSFFGVVDLISILPTYFSLLFPASKYLVVFRILRILRVFRVLKLVQYIGESNTLMRALWASRRKITVFLFAVSTLVVIFGSLMYVIEGEKNGFSSIPVSIYWAIVTLTTVGYGDISPRTGIGQMLAALIMVLGYAIIAVPTGIVTAEMTKEGFLDGGRTCSRCGKGRQENDAAFCSRCGAHLSGVEKGQGESDQKGEEEL